MSDITMPRFEDLQHEIVFSTARSGGPGGQNVNKVNSKVILKWDAVNSNALSEAQKRIVLHRLSTKLTKDGALIISSQESRSQLLNREHVMRKLESLLIKIFTPRKKRKSTKPTKASIQKRAKEKKIRSEKKQWRQKPHN